MSQEIILTQHSTQRVIIALQTLVATRPIEQLRASIDELYTSYVRHKRLEEPDGLLQVTDDLIAVNEFLQTIEAVASGSESLTRPFDYEFATVGRNIQALRISSGKDIETVAKALSIGATRLERIESGLCGDIRLTLMEKISNYFDTPIFELVKEIPLDRFAAADSSTQAAELPKNKNEIDVSSKTDNAPL